MDGGASTPRTPHHVVWKQWRTNLQTPTIVVVVHRLAQIPQHQGRALRLLLLLRRRLLLPFLGGDGGVVGRRRGGQGGGSHDAS